MSNALATMLVLAVVACLAQGHGGEMHMPGSNTTYVVPPAASFVHGFFMLAVFAFLIPATVAAGRAKSKSHRYIGIAAFSIATLAVLIMIPVHGLSFDNGHGILGWMMVAAMYFQAFMGFRASRMKKQFANLGSGAHVRGMLCNSVDFVRKFHRVWGRIVLVLGIVTGWTGMCTLAGVFEMGPIARNEFIGHSLTSIAFFFFAYSTWAWSAEPFKQAFLEGSLFIISGCIYIFLDVVTTVEWKGRFKAMSFQQHVSLACLWITCGGLTLVFRKLKVAGAHNASMCIALAAHSFGMMTHPQDEELGKFLHELHGAALIIGVILRFAKQFESAALFFAVGAIALLTGQAGVVGFGIDVGMDSTAFMVSVITFLVVILSYHLWLWTYKFPHPESKFGRAGAGNYEMVANESAGNNTQGRTADTEINGEEEHSITIS